MNEYEIKGDGYDVAVNRSGEIRIIAGENYLVLTAKQFEYLQYDIRALVYLRKRKGDWG